MSKDTIDLVLGDVHIPWPHRGAQDAISRLRLPGLRHVIQVGDVMDMYGLARFSKDPSRGLTVDQEVDAAREYLEPFKDRLYLLEGNHEYRLRKSVWDNIPALGKMVRTVPEAMGIKPARWTPYMHSLQLGKVTYVHDLGFSGANALRQTLVAFGGNIVFGHTHRAGVMTAGNARGERHVAMNVGWLGSVDAVDYMPKARMVDWTTAVGLVHTTKKGNVHMSVHPYLDEEKGFVGL